MKKLIAFLLTVSMLLTTLCMPVFGGSTCTATHDAYLLMAMGEGITERDTSKQVWYEYSTSTTHLKPTFYILKCESCGEKLLDFYTQQEEAHTFVNGICKYCFCTPNGPHEHSYSFKSDTLYHWGECSICGEQQASEEHSYGSNGVCVCGYTKASGCNHSSTEEVLTGEYYTAIDSTSHYFYQNFTVKCKGCGQEINSFTAKLLEQHYFKDGSNECYYCTYQKASGCKHSRTDEYLEDDYYEKYNSTYHYYCEDFVIKCEDCDKELSSHTDKTLEEHFYRNGSNKCYACGYQKASSCSHSKTQEMLGDDYYEQYNSTYHYYYEEIIIKCRDCKKEVNRYTDKTREKHYFKNGSNKCYYCKCEKPTNNEPPTIEAIPDLVIGIGEKTVYVNGKATTWSTPAQLISSTSYLPLKLVTQALGGYVSWNQSSLTATTVVGSKTIAFTSEQKCFYLNGYATYMNNKAMVINGVMYVPAKDYFNIFGKITNYKDGYLVITDKWISQDEIENILDYYYDTGYNEDEPDYNQPNYLNEMKAGNLYAVGNDGHLYKRVYDASTTLGYVDQYVYTPKTSYDNFSLPTGELLIQKSGYLYDTDGNKICASVSTMLACDQRIGELKDIESRNNITKSIAVSEYQQVKRGTRTLSSIAEQKVSYKAKTGSNSSTVTTIQQKLYDLGFTSQLVTGYYGSITFNNVAYFQITNNLEVTGWVDSGTYNKLFTQLQPTVKISEILVDRDGIMLIHAVGNEVVEKISIAVYNGANFAEYKTIDDNEAFGVIETLSSGDYNVRVIAYDEFGNTSNSITEKINVKKYTVIEKTLEDMSEETEIGYELQLGLINAIAKNMVIKPVVGISNIFDYALFYPAVAGPEQRAQQKAKFVEDIENYIEKSLPYGAGYYYVGQMTGNVASVAIESVLIINGVSSIVTGIKTLPSGLKAISAQIANSSTGGLETITILANQAELEASVAAMATGAGEISIAVLAATPSSKWEDADKGQDETQEKASSKKIIANMEAAGRKKPNGYPTAAHHIVAGTSKKAIAARETLKGFKIGINNEANGVFLPTQKGVVGSAYHPSLHTDEYYDKIDKLLEMATNREEAIAILRKAGEKLFNGTF